jgi:hypothetical protein
MAMDLTRTRVGNYDCTLGAYAFGAVDNVKPTIEIVKKEIKVGTIGNVVLGDRLIGANVAVEIEAREIDPALIKKLCPWWTSGSIAFTPATAHIDFYTYAQVLNLHPTDVTGTAEDLNFVKAVPIFNPMQRDGDKDDIVLAGFRIYPDRSVLPNLVYGYVGPIPP